MLLFIFRSSYCRSGELTARKALRRRQFGDAGLMSANLASLDRVDDCTSMSSARSGWLAGRGADRTVGDAAACVADGGRGHGLAMTEAYVLAGELACAGGDYRRAFDRYETRLRPFVEGKQAAAQKFLPVFASQTRLGIWFRDLVMRTMNLPPLADLSSGEACATTSSCPTTRW